MNITYSWKQCKRLAHQLSPDEILGQEIATLLASVELRCKTKNSKDKVLTAYIFSWHHLTAYITRLATTQANMDVYHEDLGNLKQPFQVQRSIKFDIKYAEQRLEFFNAIASIYLEDLRIRHKSCIKGVEQIYSDSG